MPTNLVEMLRSQVNDLAPGAETFLDFFAENGVLECPFAPRGGMHQTVGKTNIAAYLASIKDVLGSDGMTLLAAYRSPEAGVTVLEYEGTAVNERTQQRYAQKYIAVVRVRAGRIALFREYWNPLPVVEAFGWPKSAAANAPD